MPLRFGPLAMTWVTLLGFVAGPVAALVIVSGFYG
jgi:hypothetical protein